MVAQHDRILVVGGGECGTRAAMTLRQIGHTGPVTVVGDDPLHAYERPPLSKVSMAAATAEDAAPVHPYTRDALTEAGVTVHTGTRAEHLDPAAREVTCSGGERLAYDRLLLAVGSEPNTLADLAPVAPLTLRTHADAERIRRRLTEGGHIAIVGAGFIGLELAAVARGHGCQVTVIETAPRALSRIVPEAVADQVVALHREHGVDLRFGDAVAEAHRAGDATRLVLASGDTVDVETVVLGIGVHPRTELARAAGLAIDDGIRVDDRLRTSDPRVFAAGDCCSVPLPLFGGRRVRLESWRAALDQAVTVAHNLAGEDLRYEAVPWFWSDQYDQMVQMAGLPQYAQRTVVRERPDGGHTYFGFDRAGRFVSVAGLGRGPSVAKDVRIAQRMMERGLHPTEDQVSDTGRSLRDLMRDLDRPQSAP